MSDWFDPELHAASLACDCRNVKDYTCDVCRRAWNQAWDLAEGKIRMKEVSHTFSHSSEAKQ